MKEVLGLVGREDQYLKKLAEGLNMDEDFPYQAVTFASFTELMSSGVGKTARLLLSSEVPEYPASGMPVLLGFSETPEEADETRVFRYQPLSLLKEEIREKSAKLLKKRELPAEKEKATGLLSGSLSGEEKEPEDESLRRRLYRRLVGAMSPSEELSDAELYERIDGVIEEENASRPISAEERENQRALLFSSLRGYDVLSLALRDPEVTEVMVNGPDRIFIEKNGRIQEYPEHFLSREKLEDVVQRIASGVNRRVNEATPMADASLPDGSRVNLVLPPASPDGPVITVRRFPNRPISMEDLIRFQTLTEEAADFLKVLVECRYNLFISGGTGAGKTTFLGALAALIPKEERVITIEDTLELRLPALPNLVRLETRPPNLEGQYEITIRQLIRNALRMRPDRIIVGEIRGGEALDMLQAMNTGHDGSLSSGHANSAEDMLLRMETMVLMGAEKLPLSAVRSQIATALDILVHLDRFRDGSRKVTGIYEVLGVRKGVVQLSPLFRYDREGDRNVATKEGLVRMPARLQKTEKLRKYGGRLPGIPDDGGGRSEESTHSADP